MHAAKNAGHNAYIIVDKLHIDYAYGGHRVYNVNSLDSLQGDLHPYKVTSRESPDCLAFFTELNPLSNFHRCKLEIQGKKYHSVEQFFQYQKAVHAKNEHVAARILAAESALQCKVQGDRLKVDKDSVWNKEQLTVMQVALQQKIIQNDHVKQYLKKTGNKVLGEANGNDLFWGTGQSLRSTNVTNQNSWKGQNNLGKLLADLRATL
jgi:ribA/ribD-fused uncharacterized protein